MDPRHSVVGLNDTSEQARQVQSRVLSRMSPARKILFVEDANRTARHRLLAALVEFGE